MLPASARSNSAIISSITMSESELKEAGDLRGYYTFYKKTFENSWKASLFRGLYGYGKGFYEMQISRLEPFTNYSVTVAMASFRGTGVVYWPPQTVQTKESSKCHIRDKIHFSIIS